MRPLCGGAGTLQGTLKVAVSGYRTGLGRSIRMRMRILPSGKHADNMTDNSGCQDCLRRIPKVPFRRRYSGIRLPEPGALALVNNL